MMRHTPLRHRIVALLALLSACVPAAAANWSEIWQDTGMAAAVRRPDGAVTLPAGSGLVCRTAVFQPNHRYRVEWQADGTAADRYKLYVEWTTGTPPVVAFHGVNTAEVFCGDGAPTRHHFDFTAPEGSNPPYLGLTALDGAPRIDLVQWRDLTPFRSDFPADSNLWQLNGGARIGANPVFATPALTLQGADATAARAGLQLTRAASYTLTFFARAADAAGKPAGNQEFTVSLEWPDAPQYATHRLMDTWAAGIQRKELIFTVPDNAPDNATLRFRLLDDGGIVLDRIELTEIDPVSNPAPELVLTRPAYRNTLGAYDAGDRQIAGRSAAGATCDAVQLLVLNGDGDTVGDTEPEWQLRNGVLEFTAILPELPPGAYRLRLEQSAAGTVSSTTECELELRAAPPQVGIDDHRILRVDSEAFFPLSAWIPWSLVMAVQSNAEAHDLESNLYYLARNGVNTLIVLLEQPRLDEVFALANRFGLKIVLELRQPREPEPARFAAWQEHVAAELTAARRADPALLAYLLIDEPAWGGTPAAQVQAGYDFLRRLDPEHPIWVNEAPRNQVADLLAYAAGCDIYGCDIYPVPEGCRHSDCDDQTLSSVGEYTRRMTTIVDGRKPVWMILQAFAWGSMNGAPRVFPSRDSLRFMALDALSNGANAISFWGLDTVDDPAFLPEFFAVTRELHHFSGLLTLPCRAYTVTPAGVRTMHWRTPAGHDYWLAVNPTAATARVRLPLAGPETELLALSAGEAPSRHHGATEFVLAPYSGQWYGTAPAPVPAWQPPEPVAALEAQPYVRARLAAIANQRYSGEKYDGDAAWIWYPAQQNLLSDCRVKREFEAAPGWNRALLRITADDQFTLWINGRAVPVDYQGWSCGNLLDVTPYLAVGPNVIEVEARSLEAPAGVLVDLRLTYPDRNELRIRSDAAWLATRSAAETAAWVAAEVIADYGAGAWGSGVFFVENRAKTGKKE